MTIQVSGPADDPTTVATAINGVASAVDMLDRNMLAFVGLLGFLVGRAGPKGSAIHGAALDAIELFRGAMPEAVIVAGFEEAMRLGGLPGGTDGDGLPLAEGLRRNMAAMMRKGA